MSITQLLLVLLVGLCAGYLSGLLGIGGGVVIVPALIAVLGFSQQMAQGTTVGMMVFPIGLVSAFNYYKAGYIDVKTIIPLLIMFFLGSFFGSKMAISIDQNILRKVFAFLLVAVAIKMFFTKN